MYVHYDICTVDVRLEIQDVNSIYILYKKVAGSSFVYVSLGPTISCQPKLL